MEISLCAITLCQMEVRLAGETSIGGLAITEDVVPGVVLRAACDRIRRGVPARWCAPHLLLFGDPPVAAGSLALKGPPVDGRVEIGYGIAPAYTGRGLATAGARLLIRHALSQSEVNEIYAETAVTNIASRRVVEKLGFLRIGQRESDDDGLVDCWLLRDQSGGQSKRRSAGASTCPGFEQRNDLTSNPQPKVIGREEAHASHDYNTVSMGASGNACRRKASLP